MAKINKIFVYGALSGLFLSLSQPIYGLGIFSFFGLFPILKFIKNSQKKSEHFLLGYTAGLVYFLLSLKWFWSAYPLKHIGVNNNFLASLLILIVWTATAGVLSLAWGASIWLWQRIDKKISWPTLIVLPSVWTISEYLRAYLISLLWIGQENPIGPHWTVGNLAYNLHNSSLALKFSSWFGIYGLAFLIITVNVLIFLLAEKRYFKKLLLALVLPTILFFLPVSVFHTVFKNDRGASANPEIEVSIIQTKTPSRFSYSPEEKISFFKNQLTLLDTISQTASASKIVVFPEGSNFFQTLSLFRSTSEVSRYFDRLFKSPVLIIDNSKIYNGSKAESKTIFLDSQNGIVASYDKYLLTPVGEYVPKVFRLLDKVLGLNSDSLKTMEEFQNGEEPPQTIKDGELLVGVLVCSDLSSPNLARGLGSSGANVLISQSSMGFVAGSKDLIKQDLAFSKFRAAENGKYLIKAGNYGYSYIISREGLVLKRTANLEPQILTGAIVPNSSKTLYNKGGDWPILMGVLSVLISSFFWKKKRKENP